MRLFGNFREGLGVRGSGFREGGFTSHRCFSPNSFDTDSSVGGWVDGWTCRLDEWARTVGLIIDIWSDSIMFRDVPILYI